MCCVLGVGVAAALSSGLQADLLERHHTPWNMGSSKPEADRAGFSPVRVQALLNVKPGAWSTVAKELESESKYELGAILFAEHLDKVAKERADTRAYDDACAMLRDNERITTEIFDAAVQRSYETIAGFPGSDCIPDRRKVFGAMEV